MIFAAGYVTFAVLGGPGFRSPTSKCGSSSAACEPKRRCSLNGKPFGEIDGSDPGNFEVTDKLDFRNMLEVIVEQPADAAEPGGIVGEVQLEIEIT